MDHSITAAALGVVLLVNSTTSQAAAGNHSGPDHLRGIDQWLPQAKPIVWGSQVKRAAWQALANRLAELQALGPDWDGDDSVPPTPSSFSSAQLLLERLERANTPVPRLGLAGDGEIEFRWLKGDSFASASFLADGSFVGFLRNPKTGEATEIDEAARPDVPARDFIQGLRAFA